MRAFDWVSSPLGSSAAWPAPLKVTVETMLSSAIPSFVVWGSDFTLLYNDAYVTLLAGRHPCALGRSFRDVWPEIWPDLEPLVRRAYGGESLSQQNLPLRMQRKGYPEDTWFTYFYTPIRLENGRIGGFLGGCIENTEPMRATITLEATTTELRQEITEQRAIYSTLSQSEARYRALFEAIEEGFCIIEFFDGPQGPLSDYVHVEANAGYEGQTGIKNIVGRTVRDLVPDEADGWVALYGEVLRTGVPLRFERDFVAIGRIIEVSASRIEPASRHQVAVLFRDITERKRAEAALRASEAIARENIERVRLALSAGAIIGTWFWHIPTDRFTVDEEFANSFGLDPALGRDGLSLTQVVATVHPEDRAGLAAAINEAIERGGPYAHQYRVRRADGNYYWLEANGRVDHAPDGTPLNFPGVLIDVDDKRALIDERDRATTALRALNESLERRVTERTAELMQAEEALRQAQKMEAVGQLTGGIAHDFNNLLVGITGSLEFLQRRVAAGRADGLERFASTAMTSAQRAAALTQRLLAFARRQPLDPKRVDANRLVAGMEDLLRRSLGPSIELEMVLSGGMWPALCDPNQLENAILNLAINSRDAMPEGGRLTIETANSHLDDAYGRSTGGEVKAGQYISISVTDTGTGMAPDIIAKAFDPFFTTKPLGQGTGLGLSMLYGFVKQSEGHVRIYSEPGKGTTVKIYLPRLRDPGNVQNDTPDAEDWGHLNAEVGETVLVVDDEASVRMLVTETLAELGYAAIEAAEGRAALRILESKTRIDLLITDVGLPGLNGRQVADAARSMRPKLNVLFMTGYAHNAAIGNHALQPGMRIITKPFALDALAKTIREMIEGPVAS